MGLFSRNKNGPLEVVTAPDLEAGGGAQGPTRSADRQQLCCPISASWRDP